MAVGELAESSCVLLQFKRSFKRNDKPICQALCLFIAHLVNQQVADDILAFEIAIFLLDKPSGMSADTSEHLGGAPQLPVSGFLGNT